MRTRKVVVQAANGGKACAGCALVSRACNEHPCASKYNENVTFLNKYAILYRVFLFIYDCN